MKKILSLIALFFLFNSCTLDNDNKYLFQLMPIQSVEIPTEFTLGETYKIKMFYIRPTTCHGFSSLYYDRNLNIRTIAIENAVLQGTTCEDTPTDLVEHSFDFQVTSNGSYIFKFFQGHDANGSSIFLEYEIPVTN